MTHNNKIYGRTEACGYIWHTTGIGKTQTSFKTACIGLKLPYVSKDKEIIVKNEKLKEFFDRFWGLTTF